MLTCSGYRSDQKSMSLSNFSTDVIVWHHIYSEELKGVLDFYIGAALVCFRPELPNTDPRVPRDPDHQQKVDWIGG